MSKFLNRILISCLFLFLTGTFAAAQSSTATLSGTVEDPNGQVIPNATVTISDLAKGFERKVTTNDSGSFTFVLLPASTYTILVEQTGFGRAQVENVVLNVGDQKALQIQLKVGDVTAAIEVRADETLVETSPAVGTVIDLQFVQNIPLNGRSFQSLLELTPGVILTPATPGQEGGQFSVNGQRTNANYFTVDGVSANTGISSPNVAGVGQSGSGQLPGLTASGTTASLVSVDALQEFRIQTSTYAPEFGRTPGGQVSLVTRSGGNDFHGTVFDYVRNEAFDANNWFNNRNGLAKAPTRQHLFGGTFSGPVYLPVFGEGGKGYYSGKNRTFFFFSYEGLRLKLPKSAFISVPTLCFRGEAACPAGQTAALPQYQPFLRVFPKPNGAEVANGFARFVGTYSDPSSYDATSVRLDHALGKLTFFGRFANTPSKATTRNNPSSLSFTTNTTQHNTSFTAGATQTISKSIVNDIRANFTTNDGPAYFEQDGFGGGVPLSTFGFIPGRGPDTDSLVVTFSSLPTPALTHRWGINTAYKQRQFNIVDNLLISAGNHQIKLGVDFRRINPALQQGSGGGVENIGFIMSNLVGGNPQSGLINNYGIGLNDGQPHAAAFDNWSVYAQDAWKVNRRLTFTYGVRWEFVPPPHATEGPEAAVVDGLDSPLTPDHVGLAPAGTPMWNAQRFNFAPRFGASYLIVEKPGRQLVVRGGIGMFYDLGLGGIANSYLSVSFPFAGSIGYPLSGHPDPACASNVRFPLPPCAVTPPVAAGVPGGFLVAMDPDIRLPRTDQWNVSMEQSLGSHQTVTVSYVAARGRDLLQADQYRVRLRDFVYPGTTTSTIRISRNGGRSDYDALQAQFQRRLHRGFQGLVSYTFGRSRDTASSDSVFSEVGTLLATDDNAYGYSSFDVRHNLTAAATYQVPSFKGGSILHALTRDWAIDLMFRARTALPMTVSFSTPVPGLTGNQGIRPNLIPGVPIYLDDPTAPGGRLLNGATPTAEQISAAGCRPRGTNTPAIGAFCAPPLGQQGNLMRGLVRGFGAKQLDLSLRREFTLSEKIRLQLRVEAFNVFNWPNFADPSGSFSNTSNPLTFGAATQTLNNGLSGLNALNQIGGPRSMQGAIRISF